MTPQHAPARRPFLPDIKRERPGATVGKAALVAARASLSKDAPEAVAAKTYPNDGQVPRLVSKSAVSPASTGTTGWAAELAASITNDFVTSMTGMSAAAKLIDSGVKLNLDNIQAAQINIPARA